ncbi:hypothetical protein EWF95_00885 [Halonotius roseus]|uniref:Uncharacterized protein n=1 Tax=Halonotius roseus TaxID=2511997 RepID=A0A544QQ40_9EURY|nr:hypothetical protein EWF95_00885 [Halonotius roseus]
MLASPAFLQRVAPFSPARVSGSGSRSRVGMKGAGVSANPDDVSTAGVSNANDEERSESREPKRRGLSR